MKKEVLYSLKGIYRENFEIEGYRFGHGEKSACIVGAMRGNEIQQLYICSQHIKDLKDLSDIRCDLVVHFPFVFYIDSYVCYYFFFYEC